MTGDQEISPEEALRTTAQTVSETAKALQVEIRVMRRARTIERRVYVLVALLLLVMSGLTAAGVLDARNRAIESRQRGLQNQAILKGTQRTNDIILDCINAGGKCKARSDARTAQVLQQIVDVNTDIAACVVTSTTEVEFRACAAKATK